VSAELTEEQTEIVAVVRAFVDKDVVPVASELEHADEFPTRLVETMKGMGLFGSTIPEEYGGLGLGLDTYALVQMELARGWVTLPGIMNGSFIAATMILLHGTEEQRRRHLPRLAGAEIRAAFSMSEPHAGSDVQSIRTTARRDGDEYVLDGQKMWRGSDRRAREDRPGGGAGAPRHDRVSGRERAGGGGAGPPDPDAAAAQAGL